MRLRDDIKRRKFSSTLVADFEDQDGERMNQIISITDF